MTRVLSAARVTAPAAPRAGAATRTTRAGASSLVLAVTLACGEEAPTTVDVSFLPVEPVTLQINVPWADFGSAVTVYGGYGAPEQLEESILARSYATEGLDAHTLVRFTAFPQSVSVRDPGGTLRTDTDISFYGGYVVVYFDTMASTNAGPVDVALGAIQTAWHPPSASWLFAADTVADQQPWPEPGGGPVLPLTTRTWDPAQADSVQLFLDSAQVAIWDNPFDPASGARLELLTAGERLRVIGGALRLHTRSTINPDTVLITTAGAQQVTPIYDVEAPPPADGMRFGGAPAWRTALDVVVPSVLTGPPELCQVVACPFTLNASDVNYAALLLRSRKPTLAFQPTDSMTIDVRPVLDRAALPKSPIGTSVLPNQTGMRVDGAVFGALEGSLVEIPITTYARAFLSGPDPSGRPPPSTLVLLSAPEPSSFAFGEFFGPGGPNEPVLRLVVTVSPPLELQ